MNFSSILIGAILGAALGVGGSHYLFTPKIDALSERLQQSPPIVVVDFVKLASSYPDGATPEEVERLMVQTNNAILKLKDAGYLVLEQSAVVSAPTDIYLPEELFK